jgi:glycine/D-amino acid oxidase-like deaminating enzyme
MGPTIDPVETDRALPDRADVVVIGGGIIGTTATYFLAERGVSVALCEKGDIAGEQSSRNWGWCRQTMRDPVEIPLAMEALRLWRGMNAAVEAETGFRQTGILFAARDDREMATLERWLEHAQPYQLDTRTVTGAELDALMPGATVKHKGGLYTASDGRAEPQKAAPAIAAAARRRGASVLARCAVRGIERTAGRVSAVITEKGTIACSAVVLAGGVWSRLFCDGLGVRLPQLKIIASVMRTAPLDRPTEHAVWTPTCAFRKRLDGGYTIANSGVNVTEIRPETFRFFFDFLPAARQQWDGLSFRLGRSCFADLTSSGRQPLDAETVYERVRVLDPAPSEATNRKTKQALDTLFPAFKEARVVQQWAGSIDVTPDAVPVISPVEAVPGFYIATGFSGHGFGIGPGAGQLVADLVTGAPPVVDPVPFRLARYSDGSNPRPYAGL